MRRYASRFVFSLLIEQLGSFPKAGFFNSGRWIICRGNVAVWVPTSLAILVASTEQEAKLNRSHSRNELS